jgi:hypothetical protein
MNAPFAVPTTADLAFHELQPIEIDSRPCGLCGCTIDQHECVDKGEGPEFLCYPDDGVLTCWELADPRDAWRHTGEPAPPASVRNSDIAGKPQTPLPYCTPKSTIDAFFYVAALGDADRLLRWLKQHAQDAPYLRKIANARA